MYLDLITEYIVNDLDKIDLWKACMKDLEIINNTINNL